MPDIVFESQNMGRNLSTQPGIVLIISMDSVKRALPKCHRVRR